MDEFVIKQPELVLLMMDITDNERCVKRLTILMWMKDFVHTVHSE